MHRRRLQPVPLPFQTSIQSSTSLSSANDLPTTSSAANVVMGPLMHTLQELISTHTESHPQSPLPSHLYDNLFTQIELAPPHKEAFVQHLSQNFQDYLVSGISPEDVSDEDSSNGEPVDDISLHSMQSPEVISWAVRVLGVPDVPSVASMKNVQKMLDAICGVRTLQNHGALGHVYYTNSLEDIVSQEMANPYVHSRLSFYPLDANGYVDSASNALRWLQELDPNLTTPMIQLENESGFREDFYLFEPCRLSSGDYCMPYWWIKRIHADMVGKEELVRLTWQIHPHGDGWVVASAEQRTIPISEFATSFLTLKQSYKAGSIPDPGNIVGIQDAHGGFLPWTYTSDPQKGNNWRQKADGHCVYAFPIWLYCDDTSGNKSKKWNKHNSFLFTAAGLNCQDAHAQYHVHFLATSNITPPLKMLDGIVEQLEKDETHGIWSYDFETKEMVLLIVSVLAMLGDNLMQSEFACHVGFMGKLFCHCCFVKGKDQEQQPGGLRIATDNASVSSDSGSDGSAQRFKPETIQDMVQ
ncbi:hypothetical protein GYMLUDRAFT_244835 [Collybiopsis luxurians FD-317 M1]|uniref:Uncharacterized protein n=1 Tax=Collybiopsis luxurians FD-317 M1 TaxID=944289 RepID=A0A0D0CN16_9AGAR|nr:hypothetical protein GYMLUDRAFT_244835 [Collybiopsis luxurians FD-317 M1]